MMSDRTQSTIKSTVSWRIRKSNPLHSLHFKVEGLFSNHSTLSNFNHNLILAIAASFRNQANHPELFTHKPLIGSMLSSWPNPIYPNLFFSDYTQWSVELP